MSKRGLTRWLGRTACLLTVIWLSSCGENSCGKSKPNGSHPPPGQTPIVASGGSTNFTSLTGWTCNDAKTRCITTPTATLENIDAEQAAGWGDPTTIQRRPWLVTFQPISGGRATTTTDFLGLCPTNTNVLASATCGSAGAPYVLLQTFQGTSLVPSANTVQYSDPNCSAHDCVTPKTVTLLIDVQSASHLYTCTGGICQIYFY